jgi:hypothetical protein
VVALDNALQSHAQVLPEQLEEEFYLNVGLRVVVARCLELLLWVRSDVRVIAASDKTRASIACSFFSPLPESGQRYRHLA